MKNVLAVVLVLALGLIAAAQAPSSAPASANAPAPASTPAPAPSPAPAKATDLATTLTDTEAAVTATNADLASLRTDKWSSGWKTAWMKKGSHKEQAGQAAESVKQLAGTLPGMIADVRSAHGSVGSTFKLYNNLTLVCENLDSLAEATQNYGKKDEYTRLSADYQKLMSLRANLSDYVARRAAAVDPRGAVTPPSASASKAATASAAKKDDAAAPKKHVARRKRAVLRSSN